MIVNQDYECEPRRNHFSCLFVCLCAFMMLIIFHDDGEYLNLKSIRRDK